jgi:hypothetical protein
MLKVEIKIYYMLIILIILTYIMELSIKDSNKKVQISFDKFGNLYFNSDDKIYDISISGQDTLQLDKYQIIDPGVSITTVLPEKITGKLVPVSKKHSLKGKVMDEIDKMEDDDDDADSDDDTQNEDTYYAQQKIIHKYYPENKEYVYDDSNSDSDNDINTEYFKFLSHNIDIPIVEREDSLALYDTIIYDSNGGLSYKTELYGSIPIYRICIYEKENNSYIKFRPIGKKELTYTIMFNNNNDIILKDQEN